MCIVHSIIRHQSRLNLLWVVKNSQAHFISWLLQNPLGSFHRQIRHSLFASFQSKILPVEPFAFLLLSNEVYMLILHSNTLYLGDLCIWPQRILFLMPFINTVLKGPIVLPLNPISATPQAVLCTFRAQLLWGLHLSGLS